jgi:hypothetical protein
VSPQRPTEAGSPVTPLDEALAKLAAAESAARACRTTVGGVAVLVPELEARVIEACDRVLRERVSAALERALDGRPLPASTGLDSALALLRVGACGG